MLAQGDGGVQNARNSPGIIFVFSGDSFMDDSCHMVSGLGH